MERDTVIVKGTSARFTRGFIKHTGAPGQLLGHVQDCLVIWLPALKRNEGSIVTFRIARKVRSILATREGAEIFEGSVLSTVATGKIGARDL